MSEPIAVHVWSDIACPWCYVGKRRFEQAVEKFGGTVTVEYHSYELAPDTPVDFEGSEADFLAGYKGFPKAQAEQMLTQMTELAAGEGLAYDYAAMRHTKTLLAHQALHYAKSEGKQLELMERLFQAYFEQGRHVGKVDELVALGTEVGLDGAALRTALTDGTYAKDVDEDLLAARQIGVNGVPFYVIDEKYGISGAQDPSVFLQVLQRAADER